MKKQSVPKKTIKSSKEQTKKKSKFTKRQAWLVSGILLVAVGLYLGGTSLINTWITSRNNHYDAHALASNQPVVTPVPLIMGTPTHISIPNVSIDLNVIPGYYYPSNQSWTLTLDNAQWGTMTAKANNKTGLTYIYAHYRWRVFYNLPKVQVGDEAIVTTDNGHTFTYKFVSSTITSPTDTSLFSYKGKPILVLQTCSGVWFENRQLFIFDFVDVK
ncbi:MAG TPA: sortase [Patescibacteria group bacterium]|nr:sortase [Patescibacteria group bacterium]